MLCIKVSYLGEALERPVRSCFIGNLGACDTSAAHTEPGSASDMLHWCSNLQSISC